MKTDQKTIQELVELLEDSDDDVSWEAAYDLMKMVTDAPDGELLGHVSQIMDIATSTAGAPRIHAIYVLGKLCACADDREKMLDTLLLGARDPDARVRRASLFALSDCLSDDTRDGIVRVFEDLLVDKARTVRFAALEALTEALPHGIRDETLSRIVDFLKSDEVSIRWRAVLAIDKAYAKLGTEDKETALRVLTQAIQSEDIFVKVRAYEALYNIQNLEKQPFPEVHAALESESDFVQLWARYNDDFR